MLLCLNHSEDAEFGEVCEFLVPDALDVAAADLVDLLEGLEVADGDFKGGQTHDGAILLVQGVNVEAALASDDCFLEA